MASCTFMGMLLRYKWAVTLTGCDTGRCASLSGEAPPVLVYDRINRCLPDQDVPSTLRGPGRRKSVRWADEAGDEDAGFSIGGAALRQLETVYVLEGLGPPKEGPAAPKSFAEQVNPDGGFWAGLLQSSGCMMQLLLRVTWLRLMQCCSSMQQPCPSWLIHSHMHKFALPRQTYAHQQHHCNSSASKGHTR